MSAVKSRKCYLCGISGHISADCPTPDAKKLTSAAPAQTAKPTPSKTESLAFSSSSSSSSASVASNSLPLSIPSPPLSSPAALPASSSSSRKCYNCGQTGHISSLCPSNKQTVTNNNNNDNNSSNKGSSGSSNVKNEKTNSLPSSSSSSTVISSLSSPSPSSSSSTATTNASTNTTRKCYVCGLTGHLSSACPSKQQTTTTTTTAATATIKNNSNSDSGINKKCRTCGITGHIESECVLNQKPIQCEKCKKHHLSAVCPKLEPVSSSSLSSSLPSALASNIPPSSSASVAVKTRKCYNCGLVGHMSSACPLKTNSNIQEKEVSQKDKEDNSNSNESKDNSNNEEAEDKENESLPSASGTKRKGNFESERRCQMCKETGHVARSCPNKHDNNEKTCFNCGGEGHIAKECKEEKKEDERVCHECGEKGHITRVCPTKKKYRKKDSGKEICFVCEQTDGHQAKNCPLLVELKKKFDVFFAKYQEEKKNNQKKELVAAVVEGEGGKEEEEKKLISINECIELLEMCSRAMEINGCLFLYNYLVERKVALTEHIYDLLFRVYDRSGLVHSVLPPLPKTGLEGEWPRDQLRRIVKARQVGDMCAAAGENLPSILQFLEANPRGSFENLFKLATFVAKGCHIGNKQARTAVLLLHSQGALAGIGVTFKKNKSKQPPNEEELLRTALQKEFPDKQEKWEEWLSVLQAQDLVTLRDLRELDVKDLDSLPVSAALRSGLRRLQARPIPEKPATTEKRKLSAGPKQPGAVKSTGTKSKKKKAKESASKIPIPAAA